MKKYSNIQMVGHRFGRLKVLSFTEIINGRSFYLCLCDCGNKVEKNGKYLVNGDTKSCGCLKVDTAIDNSKKCITHGLSNHPLYGVWSCMKDRCFNPKCHAYDDYGGRGISVHPEWLCFQKFYDDVSPTYKEGLELDRIDNDGWYAACNFRWTTPTINKRNRRCCVFLTVNGVKKHIAQWAEETGISRHTIFGRIKYYNKKGEEALYDTRKIKNAI